MVSKFILGSQRKCALSSCIMDHLCEHSCIHCSPQKSSITNSPKSAGVGNLAFSDLCLGLIVLPLSSVYAIAGEWIFPDTLCEVFVSADILCSTASIWNLSIVGLDRYWAITSPVTYMSKR
ncbi:hypothetical protein NECAME_14609 [Necator americanus]|uniref:G-protein coupled receptors family 1 profile domain-containing protein n=1 Tax=Necator americanus TaxID=51031 RepID=W2SPN9_NECAM|nr:hypothetical protein NECAME_14609 [Necator americanus]ETN70667.1 hypothetical protein NECAME_14609 [Necator americanus]